MNRRIPFAITLLMLSPALTVQAQTARQERIKSCYQQSNDLKVEKSKWKEFMKACVNAKEPAAAKAPARNEALAPSVSQPPP